MAKNPASFQKRQRELDKKRKAEDKRKRRQIQKDSPTPPGSIPFRVDYEMDDKSESSND